MLWNSVSSDADFLISLTKKVKLSPAYLNTSLNTSQASKWDISCNWESSTVNIQVLKNLALNVEVAKIESPITTDPSISLTDWIS